MMDEVLVDPMETIENPNAVPVDEVTPPAVEPAGIPERVAALLAGWPTVRPEDDPVAPGEAWTVITVHEMVAAVRATIPEATAVSVMAAVRAKQAADGD